MWDFGVRWVGRPVHGVVLPGTERRAIMCQVMDNLMRTYPRLPGELRTYAFVQSEAVRGALKAARAARASSGDPSLWHDEEHAGTTPVLDLLSLQGDLESSQWGELMRLFRPRVLGLLEREGVGATDAEDLFAETLSGLLKPRQNGGAAIGDLLVYEQLPPLLFGILNHRLINHIRHRNAQKRSVRHTVAIEQESQPLEGHALGIWSAESADPLSGLTLEKITKDCSQHLTALQQHILSVLYIEESSTYMAVASAPWFTAAVGLKHQSSDATRRRALDREHDSALDQLADCLGLSRKTK